MTLASLRDRLSVPLEYVARHVATRPKAVLIAWAMSLVLAAWVF